MTRALPAVRPPARPMTRDPAAWVCWAAGGALGLLGGMAVAALVVGTPAPYAPTPNGWRPTTPPAVAAAPPVVTEVANVPARTGLPRPAAAGPTPTRPPQRAVTPTTAAPPPSTTATAAATSTVPTSAPLETASPTPESSATTTTEPSTLVVPIPAIVVRVWPSGTRADLQVVTPVNLQVFYDGNRTLWATSKNEGDGEGTWHWPARA